MLESLHFPIRKTIRPSQKDQWRKNGVSKPRKELEDIGSLWRIKFRKMPCIINSEALIKPVLHKDFSLT